MTTYVTLLGAEEVSRAGSAMREAAESMNSAASYMDDVMLRHQRFMEDWLIRFEDAVAKIGDKP